MHKLKQSPRGVSLVELMVVITLIGVLAGIASPGIYRAIERQNARAIGSGVSNALRTARNQAMSRGTPLWVTINTGASEANRGSISIRRQGGVTTNDAARSCREYDPANQVEVSNYSPRELGGKGAIRLAPTSPICMSPDGRVLSAAGNVISGVSGVCEGESTYILTADHDATLVPAKHIDCPTNDAGRRTQLDDRAVVRMHKISIPYNGDIRMEQ